MKHIVFFFLLLLFITSCIKEAPLNPEADILTFGFSKEYLRAAESEIYNTYVVSYPKNNVDLSDKAFDLTVTPGASWEKIGKQDSNDTLFYIQVTSQDRNSSKLYAITKVDAFPDTFTFNNWIKYSPDYLYENPKEGSFQWFSSNNGTATAFSDKSRPAANYPVHKITGRVGTGYAVELVTMVGPGNIAGGIRFIPCLAGSLFLGGFNILTGLTNPLGSTLFGVPFNNGKPIQLSGYYKYKEGTDDFINADGTKDATKRDFCDVYAILFKTDDNTQFLDGNTIATSPNRIAKAQIPTKEPTPGNDFVYFEVEFDYDSYTTPFDTQELLNNQYKMAVVFTSSTRGAYYEGRPGSTLTIDDIKITYKAISTE